MKTELIRHKRSLGFISNNDFLTKDDSLETYMSEIKNIIISKKNLINTIKKTHLNVSTGINDFVSIKKYLLSNILDEFEYLISTSLNMIEIFQAELKKIKENKSKKNIKSNKNNLKSFSKSNVLYPIPKKIISIKDNTNLNAENDINNKNYSKTETEPNLCKIKSFKLGNITNTKKIFSPKIITIKNNNYCDYSENQMISKLKKYSRNLSDSNNNTIKGYLYSKKNKLKLNTISENNKYCTDLNKIINSNISKSIRGILLKNNLNKNKKNSEINNQTERRNKIKKLIDIINENEKIKIYLKDKYSKGDYNLFLYKLKYGKINEELVEKDINLFNYVKTNNYSHSKNISEINISDYLLQSSFKNLTLKTQAKSLKNYELQALNNTNGKKNCLMRNEYYSQIMENNFENSDNKNSVLINNIKRRYFSNC